MSGMEGPDVLVGGVGLVVLGFDGVRISGTWAGCPTAREGPDVRAMAGCPAVVAADSSSFAYA